MGKGFYFSVGGGFFGDGCGGGVGIFFVCGLGPGASLIWWEGGRRPRDWASFVFLGSSMKRMSFEGSLLNFFLI